MTASCGEPSSRAAVLRAAGDAAHLGFALHPLGMTAWSQGDYGSAIAYLQESTALLRETSQAWYHGMALFSLGDALMSGGDDDAARSAYQESIDVYKRQGDNVMATFPTNSLGRMAWKHGDYRTARSLVEEALTVRRKESHAWLYPLCISLATLAEVARCQGRYDESIALSEESMARYRKLGEESAIAWCQFNLGYVAYYKGSYERSAELLHESLRTRMKLGNKEGTAVGIAVLACLAAKREQFASAARLFGAADARFESLDARLSPADRRDYESVREDTRARLGQETFAREWEAGHALGVEEAVRSALAISPASA